MMEKKKITDQQGNIVFIGGFKEGGGGGEIMRLQSPVLPRDFFSVPCSLDLQGKLSFRACN